MDLDPKAMEDKDKNFVKKKIRLEDQDCLWKYLNKNQFLLTKTMKMNGLIQTIALSLNF